MAMSTHPVLLGRVTDLNVGNTPKREGRTSPLCHVDIEASLSLRVRRVTHGNNIFSTVHFSSHYLAGYCYRISRILRDTSTYE